MKMVLVLILAVWGGLACSAQTRTNQPGPGTMNFANAGRGVNAPITNAAGIRIPGPGPFLVDLFFSTNRTSVVSPEGNDSLQAAGFNVPFSSIPAQAGYFIVGRKSIEGVPSGSIILAQIRVWDTNAGATYAIASQKKGQRGASKPFLIQLGAPGGMPPFMHGLEGFRLISGESPEKP